MKAELKRIFYVTPTNFIELLNGYEKIYAMKKQLIGAQIFKLRNGLEKLANASVEVEEMTKIAEVTRAEVAKKSADCETLASSLAKQQKGANEKQAHIETEKVRVEAEKVIADKLKDEAMFELAKVEPKLIEAQTAVN